jgi:hypothetical protein
MLWPLPGAEHADGPAGEVTRAFRGRDDHAHAAVGVATAVEEAQGLRDHPRALVFLERDGLAMAERARPLRRVGALRDRDGAELLRGRAVEVHVALGVERVARGGAHHAVELRVAVTEAAEPRAASEQGRREAVAERHVSGLAEREDAARHDQRGDRGGTARREAPREERPEAEVAQILERDAAVACEVAVDVGAAEPGVGERELERLPAQLALGDAEVAPLLRHADADDRAARRAHAGVTPSSAS